MGSCVRHAIQRTYVLSCRDNLTLDDLLRHLLFLLLFVRGEHLDVLRWLLGGHIVHLSFCHECVPLALMHFKLLIDVRHGNGNRLIQFFDCLLALLKLTLDAADGQLQQFVLSF